MQLNASHVAVQEGPSFLKTGPEGRPGEQSMLEALPRWGGRQWQHQLELNWKGVRVPSQGSSDGGRDAWQASKTQSPMGPDQKQSADGNQPLEPSAPSQLLCRRQHGMLWCKGGKGAA